MLKTFTRLSLSLYFLIGIISQGLAETPAIDRLFHSPESRQSLELKRGVIPAAPKPKQTRKVFTKPKVMHVKPKPPLPDPIMLQGYVKRSDGPNTVWINNQAVPTNSKTKDLKIGRILTLKQSKKHSVLAESKQLKKVDQLLIKIPANGKIISLKPGQRYVPDANRIDDITTTAQHH